MVVNNHQNSKYPCKLCGRKFPLSEMSHKLVCAHCIGMQVILGGRNTGRGKKQDKLTPVYSRSD